MSRNTLRLIRTSLCAVAVTLAVGLMANQANAQCSSSYGYGGYGNSYSAYGNYHSSRYASNYYATPRYRSNYRYSNDYYPRSRSYYRSYSNYGRSYSRRTGYSNRGGSYYCPTRGRYISY